MAVQPNMNRLAKDLQALLSKHVVNATVHERLAPRDESGTVQGFPFVVYSADPRAPLNESEEWQIDLFLDVWALGSWADCYREMMALDDALDCTVYNLASGVIACDRNGACYQRGEPDPDDERIRRMTAQYLLRFSPKRPID